MEKIVGEVDYSFFQDMFKTLDRDGNGYLDEQELELALKYYANRPDKLDFYLKLADTDKNGKLDSNELMFMMMIGKCDYDDAKKTTDTFSKYDLDGNGTLEKPEAYKCLDELAHDLIWTDEGEQFDEMFSTLDYDNTGYLNKIEFYMLLAGFRRLKKEEEEYEAKPLAKKNAKSHRVYKDLVFFVGVNSFLLHFGDWLEKEFNSEIFES